MKRLDDNGKRIYYQTSADPERILLNVFRFGPENDEFGLELGESIDWPEDCYPLTSKIERIQ